MVVQLTFKNMVIGQVMQVLRLAITGIGGGPDLMKTMEVIGKDQVIQRIKELVKKRG